MLSGADKADVLAGESGRWPQQVLTGPRRQVQVGAIDDPWNIGQIYEGTNQIQRVVMARQLLK